MANIANIVTTYENEGGKVTIKNQALTADLTLNLEPVLSVDAGAVNQEFTIAIPAAKIKSIALGVKKAKGEPADANVEVSIVTNNSSTPDDGPFTLTPAVGLCWSDGDPAANKPFQTDVTKIFVTNTGNCKVDLLVRGLLNSQV